MRRVSKKFLIYICVAGICILLTLIWYLVDYLQTQDDLKLGGPTSATTTIQLNVSPNK